MPSSATSTPASTTISTPSASPVPSGFTLADNASVIIDVNGIRYTLMFGQDTNGGLLDVQLAASSFNDCFALCDAEAVCTGFTYTGGVNGTGRGNCYLKMGPLSFSGSGSPIIVAAVRVMVASSSAVLVVPISTSSGVLSSSLPAGGITTSSGSSIVSAMTSATPDSFTSTASSNTSRTSSAITTLLSRSAVPTSSTVVYSTTSTSSTSAIPTPSSAAYSRTSILGSSASSSSSSSAYTTTSILSSSAISTSSLVAYTTTSIPSSNTIGTSSSIAYTTTAILGGTSPSSVAMLTVTFASSSSTPVPLTSSSLQTGSFAMTSTGVRSTTSNPATTSLSYVTSTSYYTAQGSTYPATSTMTTIPPAGLLPGTIIIAIGQSYTTVTNNFQPSGSYSRIYTSTTIPASGTVPGTVIIESPLPTLACASSGFLVQNVTMFVVDLASGSSSTLYTIQSNGLQINALGYNVKDGYLYGSTRGEDPQHLLRLGATGQTQQVLAMPPGKDFYTADIDENGQYWLGYKNGTVAWETYQVNMDPSLPNFGQIVSHTTTTSAPYLCQDWAYVPGGGQNLYSLGIQPSGQTYLMQFSKTTATWSVIGGYGITVSGTKAGFGAVYASHDGYLYGSEGFSGKIYRFTVQPPLVATFVSNGPVSGSNDGARCIDNTNVIGVGPSSSSSASV